MFGGDTYSGAVDGVRLKGQLGDVFSLMEDREWRTLREISSVTGHPEASISARLRDIRKEKVFKNYTMTARRKGEGGTWEYRVIRELPPSDGQIALFDQTYYE
jgi:DNA-binding Lrp family transcriptional regulator|tara:strand:- start:376 stop:684 length:309 start_codon:yes stop_codon:yes gene_type:complete